MKKVAIIQSNYLPWKGYFDVLAGVDQFVLYDHVQYTRRDWRNRNRVKTKQGVKWVTVPVFIQERSKQTIRATKIADRRWATKHWKTICQAYGRSKYFSNYQDIFSELYLKASHLEYLSEINTLFIREICGLLGITTEILLSDELQLNEGKNESLIGICKQLDADIYVSGPAAKTYLAITRSMSNFTGNLNTQSQL
jgi:hypothetical protein